MNRLRGRIEGQAGAGQSLGKGGEKIPKAQSGGQENQPAVLSIKLRAQKAAKRWALSQNRRGRQGWERALPSADRACR